MATLSAVRAFSISARTLNKQQQTTPDVLEMTESYTPAEIISGAPAHLSTSRVVRIYQAAKPATQSGTWGTRVWRVDWDIVDRANRWENDLMGYASSGDYMQGTEMKFTSKEAAVRFATNQGWDYYIQEPHTRKIRPKSYATNFEHSVGKLKHIRTK